MNRKKFTSLTLEASIILNGLRDLDEKVYQSLYYNAFNALAND